jgi:hypothetical protein
MKYIFLGLIALLVFGSQAQAAATADYYKCTFREGGDWNYGRAPSVCAASPFGPDTSVYSNYDDLILIDSASRAAERIRYTNELSAAIRDAAEYYMKKRKPNVSSTELAQWKFAIQLLASHESRLSHYRKTTDGRLKMMRGDFGHGHGVMQIDDRAHFNPVSTGIAWNLITNLTYGMDIYFKQWERAPSQSCVGSSTNWKARIRSAWAAYNGGPGSICRWTNTNSVWAQNDRNFLDMYENQSWKIYLTQPQLQSSIDAGCLIEKRENCSTPGAHTALIENKLYKLPDSSTCAYLDGKFHCVTEFRDALCLRSLGNIDVSTATAIANPDGKQVVKYDRHSLCEKYDNTLFGVGSYLQLQMNINMRATPGGVLLKTIPAGTVLQISDFELREGLVNDRYYKVSYKNQKGYVYAGAKTDFLAWATEVQEPNDLPTTLARSGESVKIVISGGINLRLTPGGLLIKPVPTGTTLQVLDYKIQGDDNEVYYKIKYGTSTGYIYSGYLIPNNTMSSWTKRVP